MGYLLSAILVLGSLTTGSLAFAEDEAKKEVDYKKLELNVTSLERKRRGYGKFPVVQCPGVKAKYLEIVSQLHSLQDKIKKEACPKDAQEAAQKQIANVDKLLKGQRVKFVGLVKKGLKNAEDLSEEELEVVRGYIGDAVSVAATFTGFTKNSACFDEESKNISLATVSALVSETSSAIGALAGPLGEKLQLGGKVVAGLIDGVASIVAARETYCKGAGTLGMGTCSYSAADEQAYVSNLCTYYQFKNDLDEVSAPEIRLTELGKLVRATRAQLKGYKANCKECKDVIEVYNNALRNKDPDSDEVSFVTKNGEEFSKEMSKVTGKDFEKVFAMELSSAKTNYVIRPGHKSPAFYTMKSLNTQTWAIGEMTRISQQIYEDDPDAALLNVEPQQDKIERFLFEDEAPKYIRFSSVRAHKSLSPFFQMVRTKYISLRYLERGFILQPDPNVTQVYPRGQDSAHQPKAGEDKETIELAKNLLGQRAFEIHNVFRLDRKFVKNLTSVIDEEALQGKEKKDFLAKKKKLESFMKSFRRRILKKLKAMKRKYAIFRDYCRLFKYGELRYDGPVSIACEKGHEDLVIFKAFFAQLEKTALGEYAKEFKALMRLQGISTQNEKLGLIGTLLSDVNDEDPNYTRDWVTSLTHFIEDQNTNADVILEKNTSNVVVEEEKPVEEESVEEPDQVATPPMYPY